MGWEEIIGQKTVIERLQNAVREERVAHAYLFFGPRGVGKFKTAIVMSQAINCSSKATDIPCGKCSNCQHIQSGTHLDFTVIAPLKESISIDQAHQIHDRLSYRPVEGKRKICIIDNAEKMTNEAANAALKILEEPPGNTLFILISEGLYLLPPTIISRCQLVRFNLIPENMLMEKLISWKIPSAQLNLLIQLAKGSLGKAKYYHEEDIFNLHKKIVGWMESLDTLSVFKVAQALLKEKERLDLVFDVLLNWLHALLLAEVFGREKTQFTDIKSAIFTIIQTQEGILQNVNLQIALETMLLRLLLLFRQRDNTHV